MSQSVKNARVSMTHGYDGVAECKERPTADRKITLPRGLGVSECHFFLLMFFICSFVITEHSSAGSPINVVSLRHTAP